jgi:hypothetical protein
VKLHRGLAQQLDCAAGKCLRLFYICAIVLIVSTFHPQSVFLTVDYPRHPRHLRLHPSSRTRTSGPQPPQIVPAPPRLPDPLTHIRGVPWNCPSALRLLPPRARCAEVVPRCRRWGVVYGMVRSGGGMGVLCADEGGRCGARAAVG